HTRFSRDWSSDVCSADIEYGGLRHFQRTSFFFILPVENVYSLVVMTCDEFAGTLVKVESVDRVWQSCDQLTFVGVFKVPQYHHSIARSGEDDVWRRACFKRINAVPMAFERANFLNLNGRESHIGAKVLTFRILNQRKGKFIQCLHLQKILD